MEQRGNPCRLLFIACAVLLLSACISLPAGIPARGQVGPFYIDIEVDSEAARYYVEHYSAGQRLEAAWDTQFDAIHSELAARLPTRAELDAWSQAYSVDVAALLLAQQLIQQPDRLGLRHAYHTQLTSLRAAARAGKLDAIRVAQDALFVFVPGWLYRANPSSGADFKTQRAAITRHGGRVWFADIPENASVEHNAAALATLLTQLAEREHHIVLASSSKGGPEVALALSQLEATPALAAVKAWVNIGGLMRGTALADMAISWPARWFVRSQVLPDGNFDGVASLTRERSLQRLQRLNWPAQVLIADFLALPLSGHVSPQTRQGYALLRGAGPNDGLTPVLDALTPNGVTLLNFGVDHFFAEADIEIKTLALARAVLQVTTGAQTPISE